MTRCRYREAERFSRKRPNGVQCECVVGARSTATTRFAPCVAVEWIESALLWPVAWVEVREYIVGEVVPCTEAGE